MKKLFTLFALSILLFSSKAQTLLTFHDYSTFSINGDTINLSQYYGKKVMVVNVAAHCGYTPQFTQLQQMYDSFQTHNFEIIGFPSDDFHQQGTDSDIINTCTGYNVTFPITESVHVNASPVNPIFQWLKSSSLNGVSNATVTWNFNKFLIDEVGHWVQHYTQTTLPNDQAIINWILTPSVISSAPSVNLDDLVQLKSSNPTSTSIDFTVNNTGLKNLNIQLLSSTGNLISTLYNGSADGSRNISYPVTSLASGIYFVKMQSGGVQKTVKCAVVN